MDWRAQGLCNPGQAHINRPAAALVERAIERSEGVLAVNGALVVRTGKHTGRAARDKYIVRRAATENEAWWGPINQPLDAERFDRILERLGGYFQGRELFVIDAAACADPAQRLTVRVISEQAWAAVFSQCLLIRPAGGLAATPGLTILHAPDMHLDPARDGTRSEVGVILDVERGLVVIAGTGYAGEIKKAVFTYLNYHLPSRGVFPMHCAANIGPAGDAALLFGLSGTGKTTLSADPERRLIGDDEHGWSDDGIFNFEGGCYAKCIRLSRAGEPQIWDAIRFGCILENVVLDPLTRVPDYNDASLTENTRAAYPIEHIHPIEASQRGGHPRHILFLTCDAYGVLPPLARLTPAQAQYHFLAGYTAKVAGTETDVARRRRRSAAASPPRFCRGRPPITRGCSRIGSSGTAHRSGSSTRAGPAAASAAAAASPWTSPASSCAPPWATSSAGWRSRPIRCSAWRCRPAVPVCRRRYCGRGQRGLSPRSTIGRRACWRSCFSAISVPTSDPWMTTCGKQVRALPFDRRRPKRPLLNGAGSGIPPASVLRDDTVAAHRAAGAGTAQAGEAAGCCDKGRPGRWPQSCCVSRRACRRLRRLPSLAVPAR